MNAIRKDVGALVQKELESANKKFPSTFRSRHEAYGVMLEEFEEAQDERGKFFVKNKRVRRKSHGRSRTISSDGAEGIE